MKIKGAFANLGLVAASLTVALGVFEVGLRVRDGKLLDFSRQVRLSPNRVLTPRAEYHPRLGWVPSPGAHDRHGVETVTAEGLRSNGLIAEKRGRPILTVGDSFTFGDEVADSATWPAHLSRLRGVDVLNAGVFAYGLDQAVIRARLILEDTDVAWVVLAFIRNDVSRTENSYYKAWKPYYAFKDGELVLNNTPVPDAPAPRPKLSWLRPLLSRSVLASELAGRYAAGWWYYGAVRKEHKAGPAIATQLVRRLRDEVASRSSRLLVVALATGGRIGTNQGMDAIVTDMRAEGVEVLDLVAELEAKMAFDRGDLVMPGGHYSPVLNQWVAKKVADRIDSLEHLPASSSQVTQDTFLPP